MRRCTYTDKGDTMRTAVITCNCKTCDGLKARVDGDGTRNGKPYNATAVHNFVRIAHSPLSRSGSSTVKPA